ncbi:hypothetical protein AB0M28_04660 [Streptomyces sp. NPDC051940]|uniref:hypothetical protein n=1 Tax=Streptomyces sp. NPDC051940 TaxID=3155675 RepID=UPI0034218DB2
MSGRLDERLTAPLLDRLITAAAARAGAPGEIRFTERQLYYAVCRLLRPVPERLRRHTGRPAPPLRLPVFSRALRARTAGVPGLLPEPGLPAGPVPGPAEPDLYDYGLPRVLVCQDRAIARMLLANHVHLEAACPVLHAAPDTRLLAALERAEGAVVYVLHDASPAGVGLPARVREAVGPVPGVGVVSLGLVPRHAAALGLVAGRAPAGRPLPALPAGLRPRERDWLAQGRFAEVAALPPDRLLRGVIRLTRGPRPPRTSAWSGFRERRDAGFMTWPGSE